MDFTSSKVKSQLITSQCDYKSATIRTIFKRKKSFILMYHLVCQELNYDSLNKGIVISKTTFLRQIKLLRWLGFLFIGPSDIRIKNGVLMTFDDGYAETYREIKDIVKYEHIPALFFLCPRFFIEGEQRFWWNELEKIQRSQSYDPILFMDILQQYIEHVNLPFSLIQKKRFFFQHIRSIFLKLKLSKVYEVLDAYYAESGVDFKDEHSLFMSKRDINEANKIGFEWGAHTYSHISIAAESCAHIEEEIIKSDTEIERIVDYKPDSFAYPFGVESNDSNIVNLIRSKYKYIYTTRYGFVDNKTNLYAIPRISISEADGTLGFINKISGAYLFLYKIFDGR